MWAVTSVRTSFRLGILGIRHSSLIRHSSFGFRHSPLRLRYAVLASSDMIPVLRKRSTFHPDVAALSHLMAEFQTTPPPTDPQQEIRVLLEEIRKQNLLLKRYLFLFGAGLALMLLLQFDWIKEILNYAVIVVIVMAVLLSAPLWSQIIVNLTDRIPWFPKRKS